MSNNKYSDEIKKKAVEEYLSGSRLKDVMSNYGIKSDSQIRKWRDQYLEYGCFPDGRRKRNSGRPKSTDKTKMTKDEYIEYLEMENDILKQLRSLSKSQQK